MSFARYLSKLGALLNSDGKITADAIADGAIPASNDASALTTGTVATARLGSGTANSSTYLRGDQTWATVSGGVTSVATGNGLTGGTITTTGTISITAPSVGSVGDYIMAFYNGYPSYNANASGVYTYNPYDNSNTTRAGTWRNLGSTAATNPISSYYGYLWVRVA